VIAFLVPLLESGSSQLARVAMRLFGNMSAADDGSLYMLAEEGLLEGLCLVLDRPEVGLRTEACWILSNFAVGELPVVEQLLEVPGLFDKLQEHLESDVPNVQKEILFVFCNLCYSFPNIEEYLQLLERVGWVEALCELLRLGEPGTTEAGLQCLKTVLDYLTPSVEDDSYLLIFTRMMQQFGGILILEDLQKSPNANVYRMSTQLLRMYFETDWDRSASYLDPVYLQ
jgi:hypothetical protein